MNRFCLQKGGSQEHISLRQHNLAAVWRIVKFWGFPPKDNNNITYSFNNNCQTAGVTRNKMIYRPSNIQVNKLPGKTLHISLLYAHLPPHRWMDYSTVDGYARSFGERAFSHAGPPPGTLFQPQTLKFVFNIEMLVS